jgi:hypothetical protein
VTIPARARIGELRFGISYGTFGTGRTGPVGLHPILTRIRMDLEPGPHAFRLSWTAPAELGPGAIRWVAPAWTGMLSLAGPAGSQRPLTSASVAMPVIAFFVPR